MHIRTHLAAVLLSAAFSCSAFAAIDIPDKSLSNEQLFAINSSAEQVYKNAQRITKKMTDEEIAKRIPEEEGEIVKYTKRLHEIEAKDRPEAFIYGYTQRIIFSILKLRVYNEEVKARKSSTSTQSSSSEAPVQPGAKPEVDNYKKTDIPDENTPFDQLIAMSNSGNGTAVLMRNYLKQEPDQGAVNKRKEDEKRAYEDYAQRLRDMNSGANKQNRGMETAYLSRAANALINLKLLNDYKEPPKAPAFTPIDIPAINTPLEQLKTLTDKGESLERAARNFESSADKKALEKEIKNSNSTYNQQSTILKQLNAQRNIQNNNQAQGAFNRIMRALINLRIYENSDKLKEPEYKIIDIPAFDTPLEKLRPLSTNFEEIERTAKMFEKKADKARLEMELKEKRRAYEQQEKLLNELNNKKDGNDVERAKSALFTLVEALIHTRIYEQSDKLKETPKPVAAPEKPETPQPVAAPKTPEAPQPVATPEAQKPAYTAPAIPAFDTPLDQLKSMTSEFDARKARAERLEKAWGKDMILRYIDSRKRVYDVYVQALKRIEERPSSNAEERSKRYMERVVRTLIDARVLEASDKLKNDAAPKKPNVAPYTAPAIPAFDTPLDALKSMTSEFDARKARAERLEKAWDKDAILRYIKGRQRVYDAYVRVLKRIEERPSSNAEARSKRYMELLVRTLIDARVLEASEKLKDTPAPSSTPEAIVSSPTFSTSDAELDAVIKEVIEKVDVVRFLEAYPELQNASKEDVQAAREALKEHITEEKEALHNFNQTPRGKLAAKSEELFYDAVEKEYGEDNKESVTEEQAVQVADAIINDAARNSEDALSTAPKESSNDANNAASNAKAADVATVNEENATSKEKPSADTKKDTTKKEDAAPKNNDTKTQSGPGMLLNDSKMGAAVKGSTKEETAPAA